MNINQNFVVETNKLVQQAEILCKDIKNRYAQITECLEEMREKYSIALTELKKEFETMDDVLCGFSTDGHRKIESVVDHENYCEVVAGDYFRDWEPKRETIKIPYNPVDDESFVKEYKEIKKKEFLHKREIVLKKELTEYLKLKKKFEN